MCVNNNVRSKKWHYTKLLTVKYTEQMEIELMISLNRKTPHFYGLLYSYSFSFAFLYGTPW